MRYSIWFIVFAAACAGPAPAPSVPVATDCSQCPTATCPEVVCPKETCPTCPEPPPPPPPPPPPVAKDWYCVDLHQPDGTISGFCFTLKSVCEEKRQEAIDNRWGKTTQCMTQRIAHCIRRADPMVMSHRTVCTRTAESCEQRRLSFIKHSPAISSSTECHAVLNIDTFETPLEFNPNEFP